MRPPKHMPSAYKILLPTRAFLLSWRDQNLPARHLALEDAAAHFELAPAGDYRDMALLGVIGEAVQCLEDFAVLASSWDSPWEGFGHYLRATEWTPFKTNNFWQEAPRWSDDRIDVLACMSFRNPGADEYVAVDALLAAEGFPIDATSQEAMDIARQATRTRLRRVLGILAADWKQFSPYFLAYKHGGLTLSRSDLVAVDDDVDAIDEDTTIHDLAIAVWRKSSKSEEIAGDELNSAEEIAEIAAGSGRIALDLIDAFIVSRSWTIEALEWGLDGEVESLRPLTIPWTVWLRECDLPSEHWELLGAGPTVTWVDENDRREPPPDDELGAVPAE